MKLTCIRELDLSQSTSRGRPHHLSAASGLVIAGSNLYVIADDELHMGAFDVHNARPGSLIRVFPGELPQEKERRKASKPDLEALALLPASGAYAHGALLAMGSGSAFQRRMGAVLALDSTGAVTGPPRLIDCTAMFAVLSNSFADLNIEGAFVGGDELVLLQRRNAGTCVNAIIRFRFEEICAGVQAGMIAPLEPLAIHPLALGSAGGVPLGITDAAALPNGDFVFSAVAEDTTDSYRDGPCVGAAIGISGLQGNLRCLHRLDQACKVEGIAARTRDGTMELIMVTDADDMQIPARLYSARLP